MKKLFYILLFSPLSLLGQSNNFFEVPDPYFLSFLQNNYPDIIVGNNIDITTASNLNISWLHVQGDSIENIDGIQYLDFGHYASLRIENTNIISADLSGVTDAKSIIIASNQILENLQLPDDVQYLDLHNNVSLNINSLYLNQYSYLQGLGVSSSVATSLNFSGMNLNGLTLSENPNLNYIALPNSIGGLSLNDNPNLNFETINFSQLGELSSLEIQNSIITTLNLSTLNNLYSLQLQYNSIETLNLPNSLVSLYMYQTWVNNFPSSNFYLHNLTDLSIDESGIPFPTILDLGWSVNLSWFSITCDDTNLETLILPSESLQGLSLTRCFDLDFNSFNWNQFENLQYLYLQESQIDSLDLSELNNLVDVHLYGNNNLEYLNISGFNGDYPPYIQESPNLQCIQTNNEYFEVYPYPLCEACGNDLYLEFDSTAINFNSELCQTLVNNGCTDSAYVEFDPFATGDDGSCQTIKVYGCTQSWADNYADIATTDDGSCDRLGCTSGWADNFDSLATQDDNSCFRVGCIYDWADNYDALATTDDDGSCERLGCTSEWADNFDSLATDDDGSCERLGCTSDWADNYDALATDDDGSCERLGCTSDWADNYDSIATDDDDSCYREGCMYDWADNFDSLATINDTSCYRNGCTYEWAFNYDSTANIYDGSCYPIIYGCMFPWADNYIAPVFPITLNWADIYVDVNTDDGSCYRNGCTSDWADNFDLLATDDDGSCERMGCTSEWADNYDELATTDDGSCYKVGCMSDWADNYDTLATIPGSSVLPPAEAPLNTGAVLTVMLTPGFVSGLNIQNETAYIVAFDGDLIVGYQDLSAGTQQALAIWGDDSMTPEQDGALTGASISFQLVDGSSLYDVEFANPVTYTTSGLNVQTSAPSSMTLVELDDCYRLGCMSDWADNYDELATEDDGSCERLGCTEEWADNFDALATEDDGSCERLGCTDTYACNFDILATVDDDSCEGTPGCMDISYLEYDSTSGCNNQAMCFVTWQQAYNSLEDSLEQEQINHLNTQIVLDSLQSQLVLCNENLDYWSSPIVIDLLSGWNMIGYTFPEPQDLVATVEEIDDIILIIKDNNAEVYWPEFGFNGIGDFTPGHGYQIKVSEEYLGFTYPDVSGQRIELTPTVPIWAIDMEVEIHPNDIRTLVRVVNMLGQEVDPEMEPRGSVLLYLYNDATVEKKLVE